MSCSIEGCDGKVKGHGLCNKHYQRWKRRGNTDVDIEKGSRRAFFEEALLSQEKDDCILWPYSRDDDGYASLNIDGVTYRASRLACVRVHGEAPTEEHQAAHSCGRGHFGCINPHHLSWKTRIENAADKSAHGTAPIGEANGRCVITEEKAREILSLKGKVSYRRAAARFGVGSHIVRSIFEGRAWRHLSEASS